MKPLRVAMIIQNFFPVIGGAEKQAQQLSEGLVKRGVVVDVLTRFHPSSPSKETIRGVAIHRLVTTGTGILNALSFVISSTVYLLTHWSRFDVLHVHLASSHALVPAVLGHVFGKKVVIKLSGGVEIGELALSRKSGAGRMKLNVLAWAKPSFVVVNQEQRKELQLSSLAGCPVTYIPNGVDLVRYQPPTVNEKEALRKKLGWEGLVFLFVGRFAEDKLRLDIFNRLLDAWAPLSKNSQQIYFYLVGEGPLEKEFDRAISRRDLEGSVEIIGSRDQVANLYKAADVFVLPSITEGLSNALLEAMACGLPVVGSRVSGIVDIIKEGAEGFLFDPLIVEEITVALEKILKKGRDLDEMGRSSREKATAYSMESTLDKTIQLYQGKN